MSWLLDADVLSQPAKRTGDHRFIAWLEQEEVACHTSTIVVCTARLLGAHGLTIVTGNDRDFRRPGIKVFNPFDELA